jgi:hypothetical protein
MHVLFFTRLQLYRQLILVWRQGTGGTAGIGASRILDAVESLFHSGYYERIEAESTGRMQEIPLKLKLASLFTLWLRLFACL